MKREKRWDGGRQYCDGWIDDAAKGGFSEKEEEEGKEGEEEREEKVEEEEEEKEKEEKEEEEESIAVVSKACPLQELCCRQGGMGPPINS